jgi:hypothetical protein
VRPLVFPVSDPEEERVPEGKLHVLLKFLLFQLLRDRFADRHSIGCDQFLFWNARDPGRRCAPDGFVKLDRPDDVFRSWKTWERGTPELVIEIEGEYSGKKLVWSERFDWFAEIGTREIVRFDFDGEPGSRLHAWDRIEDDLVERVVEGESTPCLALGLWWVVVADVEMGTRGLRLAHDERGTDLLLSRGEAAARRIEADARRMEADGGGCKAHCAGRKAHRRAGSRARAQAIEGTFAR